MVGFYKHSIAAWMDGTEGLSDGAYRAYHVIVQLIMLNEGPIAMNERGIAGRCNQTLKTFRVHLDVLLAAGKLTLRDGRLSNQRAEDELQAVMKNRENAGKGGSSPKKTGQKSADQAVNGSSPKDDDANGPPKPLKNNDVGEAPLNTETSLKEKRREESTPIIPKGIEAGFQRLRSAYPPRHVSFPTTQARKRYEQAIKGGATHDEIEVGAKAYAAEQARIGKSGTEFVKSADSWLHQRRWLDYAHQDVGRLGAAKLNPEQDRRHRLRLAQDHFRDEWRQGTDEQYRPGTAGCTTAPEIVEEARLAVATERIMTERPLASNAA